MNTTLKVVSEESFLPTLVSKISNKIRDVSTVDLNEDGIVNILDIIQLVNIILE